MSLKKYELEKRILNEIYMIHMFSDSKYFFRHTYFFRLKYFLDSHIFSDSHIFRLGVIYCLC